jgi:hypothetical protein
MGHFAKVFEGKVAQVIVAEPEFFETFVDTSPGEWIQTSYNTRGGIYYEPNSNTPASDQSKALRKNYAGLGYSYNTQLDAFIAPQPYPSWTLNEDTCLWEAPTPMPDDGKLYQWNESNLNWEEIEKEQ